jgi:cysteine synthase B
MRDDRTGMRRLTPIQEEIASARQDIRGLDHRSRDRSSLLGWIGNTPLLRIRTLVPENDRVEIYAKAEWFNPGGSVKDRAALFMLREAERTGALTSDRTIIDATSGNTGIAYAMIGSALGYSVMLAVPANASSQRLQALRAYGATIRFTDPLEGTDGAQRLVRELVEANPDRFYHPDQYNNPANWRAHYGTTAPEIWEQSRGRITHFVAGLGTTGTFIGTSRRLKELNPSVSCISFEPDSPLHGMEGLKHLGTALVPGIYDAAVADGRISISTAEARAMAKKLAREEGLYVGVSSGGAMAACLKVGRSLPSGVIVTVFPDGGSRYGSEIWTEGRNEA